MNTIVLIFATICVVAAKPHLANRKHHRVTGGVDAGYREFPHQVSLQKRSNKGHFCGGSILNENWVLTAAHCKGSLKNEDIEVVAGEHDFAIEDESVQRRRVVEFILHENFKPGSEVGPYDIALIRVDKPFVFGEGVKPVNLPERESIPHGAATITGWGSMSNSVVPDFPDVLQKATLPIVENEQCSKMWQAGAVHETNICAGSKENTCAGDSGGPLIQTDSKNNTVQIGIVSWGSLLCGDDGRPGVFTRVSYYIDWIQWNIA